MKFITNIPADRFNAFAAKHQKNHFLQSYEWGVFKSKSPDWSFDTVGLEDENGQLVAGALVLLRQLPLIKRPFIYIPRGYLIDFSQKQLVETFTKSMKQYAQQKKLFSLKLILILNILTVRLMVKRSKVDSIISNLFNISLI